MPRLTPSTAGSSPTTAALSEVKCPARAVVSNQVLVETTAPFRYMPHSVAFSCPNRNCSDWLRRSRRASTAAFAGEGGGSCGDGNADADADGGTAAAAGRAPVVAVVHEDDATAFKSISAAIETTARLRRQDARHPAFTSVGVSRLR